jgi:hypothetical protein
MDETGVYLRRAPVGGGPGGGGPSTESVENLLKALATEHLSLSLCSSSDRGTWGGGGSFTRGLGRFMKGSGDGIWGSVGQPEEGSSTTDFEIWLKGVPDVGCLYGGSVKGTWREGSLVGDPDG